MPRPVLYKQYQIHCSSMGKGEILLFLHGWPTNSSMWQSQIETFKGQYRTVAIDWLGFGRSDKPANHNYTFTNKKKILNAVLADLLPDGKKVNIIAHDLGGPPAILWASENQERVRRLILLNTVIYPFSTLMDTVSHLLLSTPVIGETLVSRLGLRYVMRSMTKKRNRAVKDRIEAILAVHHNVKGQIVLKTILQPLEEGRKNELLSLAGHFQVLDLPKYLVIAKNDPLCFSHMKRLREENYGTPAYFIDDCGHFIPLEQPDKLNAVLMEILSRRD